MSKCMRCFDGDLIQRSPDDSEYELYKCYDCPNCGTIHEVYLVDDDEKQDYPINNPELDERFADSYHGYDGFCPECGSHIIWNSDFMRSEVLYDVDESEEAMNEFGFSSDDSLAVSVSCPYCGSEIMIIDTKPSDYSKYPYYSQNLTQN